MIKTKVPNLAQLARALETITDDLKQPDNMQKYGQMSADMIKLRTRLGSGVASAGEDKRPLNSLKDSTVEERARLRRRGELSEFTTPKRSNLTRTGQLLDSLKVLATDYGSVIVGASGVRKDGETNEAVAEGVTAGGRAFLNHSKIELKRLTDQLKRDVRESIKRRRLTIK